MQGKVGDAKAMAAGTAAAKEEEDAEMKALEEALQKRREDDAAQAAAKAKVPLGASDNGATKDQDITRPRYFVHGTGDAAGRRARIKFLKSVSEMLTFPAALFARCWPGHYKHGHATQIHAGLNQTDRMRNQHFEARLSP